MMEMVSIVRTMVDKGDEVGHSSVRFRASGEKMREIC